MKRTLKKLLILLLTGAAFIASCDNFEELNIDPNRTSVVTPGAILNPVLYEMSVFNWERARGWTFSLMQVSLSTLSSGGIEQYIFNDNAGNSTWNNYYRWLNNVNEIERLSIELEDPNYQAVAITLRSYIMHMLTDAFGDVPMKEAGRGDEGLLQPKFDTQQEVYNILLEELERANSLYNSGMGLRFNAEGEFLYKTGNTLVSGQSQGILKWKKFNNSLRLRIAMRMTNKDPQKARQEVEKIFSDPTTYPVFENNSDGALLAISGVFPMEPPMARPQDFTAYRGITSFFIDNLNSWNDPRRDIFCTRVNNEFLGWPSGFNVAPTDPPTPSNLNQQLARAPLSIVILPYSEISFIRAEAAYRGWNNGGISAMDAYNEGVKSSIEQWGASMPSDYFDNPAAVYNNTLERIMLQKYFSLFFCDHQQWFEHLRTGFPNLPIGSGIATGNKMPTRFKYPEIVQRTNLFNYQEVVARQGGDTFHEKLWYQK